MEIKLVFDPKEEVFSFDIASSDRKNDIQFSRLKDILFVSKQKLKLEVNPTSNEGYFRRLKIVLPKRASRKLIETIAIEKD